MNNVSAHFAERLKSARIMNGLSLQGLADKLETHISKQALHKYEKGDVMPDSEMINVLSNALGLRTDYFYRMPIEIGRVEFRKLKSFPIKEKNKIIEQTKDELSRYLELEEIIGIENKFVNHISNIKIKGIKDVEDAANELRSKWDLGTDPMYNVLELLEDKEVKVVEVNQHPDFSGMQCWVNEIPVIVVNTNREIPIDRIRFTALHELGHLILNGIEDLQEKERERYCNYFAAAMLFHHDAVKKEIGGSRNRLYVNELGVLKQQYGISIQAIAYRLKDLGFISESYLKQFMFFVNQMGIRKNEPERFDFQGTEKSNRFEQLIYRALAEELITMSKAASLKNMKLAEFHKQHLLT